MIVASTNHNMSTLEMVEYTALAKLYTHIPLAEKVAIESKSLDVLCYFVIRVQSIVHLELSHLIFIFRPLGWVFYSPRAIFLSSSGGGGGFFVKWSMIPLRALIRSFTLRRLAGKSLGNQVWHRY
jgi:hypothetical protein